MPQQYIETTVGTLSNHKCFKNYAHGDDFESLPKTGSEKLHYVIEFFVNYYISVVIPTPQEQLGYVENAVMNGIHDVFPADGDG